MKLRVLGAVLSLSACGAGPGAYTGSSVDNRWRVRDAIFGGEGGRAVYLSSFANACSVLKSGEHLSSGWELLLLTLAQSSQGNTENVGPGSYSISTEIVTDGRWS